MTKKEIIDILTALEERERLLRLRDRETEHGKLALGRAKPAQEVTKAERRVEQCSQSKD